VYLLLIRLLRQDAEALPHERERGVESRHDTAYDRYDLAAARHATAARR
jgi:hypothetical protein